VSEDRQTSGVKKWVRFLADVSQKNIPTASNPYWRTLRLRRIAPLLVGTFLLSSVIGFAYNLVFPDRPPILHGVFWPLLFPTLFTCVLVLRLKKPRWATLAGIFAMGVILLALQAQIHGVRVSVPDLLRREMLFNAIGIALAVALGNRIIFSFLTSEGVASVRTQTELALAQGIQATLVPVISLKTARFEVYGISLPSAEVGGDLVDVIAKDGNLLAYVADISGHGLPAGQLMGMLKTAMRVSLELKQRPVALLENADRVLPSLKEPDMYATLALLRFDDSAEAEYALAGHPPILHYRKPTNDVVRLAMQQFPVGLLGNTHYVSARTEYSRGDLFLILTDGITEAADGGGEEFGVERVEKLIVTHAARPLSEIWKAIRNAAILHGAQRDDQSALMVRAV
jgi:serine phosphatase RsbU (regulator of sigma subunit)